EQLELNSLKKQILGSVSELFESQTKAQISVPDVDVQQMISDLLVGNGDGRSQSIASEEGSLNELEQLSSSNSLAPFTPQSNNAIETVRLLNERFQKRRIDQQNRIEEVFSRCLREFRDGLSALEAQLGNSIERKDVETMELLQRIEYAELRKKLELFNDSLRKLPSVTETAYWKRKWAKRFQQLQSNLNIFGENLMSAKVSQKIALEEREDRKEQKMLHNLSSFGKWLHLVESEVLQLHSFCQSADFELDQNERRVKLTKLRDNCVQHFRLVVKLQTHQFASEEQAELAKRLCQQYRKVMEQFEKMQLPISHLIPVKKANENEMLNVAAGGVSTRAQSQLSLDSSTPSDLDSDLASIHSEVLVAEALSHLCQPSTSSASSESSLIHQLSTTKIDSKLNELPMDQIEREVQQLLLAIDHLHARYYTPKPLGEAQQDAASLKLLAKQLTELKADLNKIAEMASDDNKKQLQKVLSNLKREKNGLKRFHRALTDEVEDEIELRTNYAQTAEHLSDLDNEIRSAASEGRVPQTSAVLPRIELQIEMLKKQCRATRKYVEMSVDGSTATSPTRRKRIIFKLSNSVTTIIQVIENKLRQEEEAAKKKHRKDKSESETELSNLHKKLTALKRETESEMEVADSDEDGSPRGHESVSKKVQSIVVRRSTTIHVEEASSSSKMLDEQQQQTKATSERENGISAFLQQVQQMVQKSELVRQKLEELISTGGEVPEAGQHHGPLIQKVRSELDELLSELNGVKMEESSSVVVLNCKDKLTHLVEAFGVLDSNYQQKLEQQKAFRHMLDEQNRKMNEAISDGERLLMDPEATLEQFQSAIDDLDKVGADIHSAIVPSNPPTFVSNELKKGLGHLNAIKQRLVREHSLSMETKMAVAEGVEKLRRLRQQKDEVAALLKNGGAAEAFGVVKEMEIYGRSLKLVADKLKTLEVELPIIAEIDEHLRLIEATKKEIRKRMDKDQAEELQKSKWPERVTEVFLDVMLVRTETEDIENECIKKVVLNIPKRRTWNDDAASKKDQLREQTARFNESLVALVRQAHEKLDEPAAMPQSYEQLANGLDEPIEHAEQFVTENAAAVGEQAATLISSNIAEAKEVRGRLVQRWQHWLQFVRQRELGTAQLDKARVAIELAEQKACRSLPDAESDYENLMEAQSSLTSLNATIDQLQQLADKLDPLAMAYAEVRFLDVDFEQLEKHYGDVLGQMHNEIEHERALMAEIERTDRETDDLAAQLPSMDTNLKALQHVQQTTIPSLEAKIVMLEQQSQQQKPLRKYVLRSTADASPDGLAQRVEQSKTQAQEAAQQLVDRSVARIRTVLVQSPAASEQLPSDQRIDECAKELEEDIPLEHPLNNELRQQLEQLRGKVKRRDAIQSQIDERLTTIGKELEEFSDQFDSRKMPSKKEDKRAKKKGKRAAVDFEQHQQQQQCAAEKVPREEQINELRKALERLENGIVPTLSSLQDEAVREGIPLQPTEEQQHQLVLANQIVQSLKTDLDKRVAENERASAVINEIRVLRSLVEGMVVEQTAEEASLQLNLESVSQQQKDVEEAAKTLGEQLGKVAAKSQEISSNSLHPEEQALMKESEEEANRKMERLNSLNTVLQQQIELLRAWARDKDSLELRTSSLIDDFKKVEEKRPQEGQVTAAAAEEELAKLDALKSGVGEARDEMMRMQCWLVQKLPKCGRAQIELQLQPVEDSLVQLNTDLSGTMQQLNKCVEFEHNLLEERTALLNALDHLNEQVQLARAIEDPHDQSSELDKLQNELEHIEQQMRNLENKSVDPTQTTSQIAHSVNITMTSIADARHQLEARIAQKARDEHLREQTARFNESLVALVRQAHEKLDEPAAMPQSYEQLANGLDEPIEHAEQFVTENAAAVGEQAATLISSNIAEAKEVRGRLVQRWQHWLQFVRQRELGTAQLDKARVAIELAEQKACRSLPDAESDYENLMEAQSSLTSLNATIDQLQQLADKLDPLAMAYAEVRFLDVDFEQLEKHYGDVLGQMHNEIEHERALMAEIERTDRETDDLAAQLPSMDTNLKALQHVQQTTIPSLEAKVVMLEQQSQQQKALRKYVLRSTAAASPDGLAQRVEQSKTQAQEAAQQLVDRSVARIRTVLVQSPAASEQLPSDQRIDECAKELEEDIPLEHPLNNELRQQLEQLRGKVKRRDAIQSQIDERLTTIGKELEEFSDQFDSRKMPSKKEDKRAKKKGKKAAVDFEQHQQQQQCAAEKMPREEQINELRKALERLENGIVPTLSSLQDEAVREGIPLQPTEEQQHQLVLANQIVQSLKTDLDKKVAENERASAVINEIRVLRSLVEGMVVEQTAEEASLQLNLESVSQQQKDVEEAAKTLGEQLGKVAAKSQEISSNSLHPEEQALMKESEEEANRKMERLNSLNTVLQQQIELLRAWARDKDSLELRTSSLIDDFKKVEEKRPQEGQVTAAAAEEELAKLDALKSGVGEARDEMMRMQCWLVQKLPKCGRAQIELQLQPVEDSLVQLNTDLSGTMQQLNKCVEFEHNLLEERTALLNALDYLNEQNELEHIEQQMRNLENKSMDPTQTTSQIAHSVNITMASIADARHQLEARIAQKARDEHLREQTARFNESLVALVRQAHDKLDEPAAMPQSYEQLGNGLDEPIEHAEQFVTENAAAVGEQAATLISSNIAEAKEVRGRLVQRWQHWLQFVRQRELGTAQLDKARVAIELAEQKACRSLPDAESDYENLMEAQSSLTSLNATIDQLQQLADKLDPLAMAYAEVRFLDVDFEQLEKHYGDVLGQMHNEIEHERALLAEIERTDRETDDLAAQLPSMDTNLKALQHVQQTTIPTLEAKIVMLEQQSQQQKALRKYVLRSTADASPDGLAQRVEQSKTQAQEAAQQLVDRSVARIRTVLVQSPAASEQLPSDQRIDECAKELEEDIPLEHPLNNELRQQLEQLRGKVKRRDAIQSQIDERLTTIGKELEEFSDQFDSRKMPSKKEDKRAKKKGKRAAVDSEQHQQQQQQCAAEKVPREEQINELRKALERLENGIVPTLSSLQDEAVREGIPLQPTEEQQHQLVLANQIVQSLKTDLDKKVAENERASAVINEIRVLRSLVEGMVVEQTAEEASLQLNLESVSQQQKDVEEAAKTLGEQLGKVAAKSQEISSNSLHPEEQALMKESEEEANRKMERLNSLNTMLQQQIELLRAWARDKDSLELRTSSLIDDFKKVEEKRPQEGQVTAAAAEEELAKLDALKSGVGEARDEMMRMQCWLVQKLPKCGRAQIELQLQPVEDSLVQLNTDLGGTMQQLNKCVEFEHNLLEERTALLNALDHLNEQVQLARAIEDPHDQSSEMDKLQNELEHIEQQMRNLENKSVDPTQTTSQIAHSVNITMTSIADARHQLEARIAQKARDEHLREQTARFNESLVALVRQAHEKLDEPAAMPQSYEQLANGLDEPIEHAEQFVTENAAAVGEQAATLISSNIAEAKEVRGRLVQRWQHWLQFVRQRELGTAQLDKARVAIELAEQKACQSLPDAESDYENLMEAQSSLTSLNATIDQLQQLADKLDPLAMAYAEVRFLDVDFEQLEKHYGDVLGQMHNEIEHERALLAEIERTDRETDDLAAQLPSMDTNLKALQHVQQTTIPTLEAKIVMLEQQSQQQKPLRKYVLRSIADASPDGLAQRVEQSKTQAQEAAQQLVDRSVARIRTVLVQSPAASEQLPSDQRIDECAKELEEDIPLEHPLNNELRQQLEQLREKVKRRDAIQSQIDERLTTIGKELEEFSDQFDSRKMPSKKEDKRAKKKGKRAAVDSEQHHQQQQQQCAAEKVPREEQINELRKALERLENGIVPTLSSLQDEAVREGIPLQPTEEQQHQLVLANQIVQSLKTDLDKRVAENERASAVINEIRVLRSLVEGMVVEQTAEEASLQLNLESVSQQQKDVEEAAKTLGEQLGKVAAKSQEISSNSLHPEEQALMKESEEEANRKMERLNSLNTVLQQQIELLRAWARDKDSLELRTSSLIDDFKKVEEKRPQEGQVTAAAAEEELAKLDALKSGVGEARDEMMRMQCWLVQKLPKCGRAQIELQLQPVEDSLVQLNTDLSGTMQQLNKCVEFEHNLLEERTALLNALDHLNEQVQLARAIEDPHDQSSELDKLQNQLEHIEQQMRNLENKSVDPTQTTSQIAHSVNITMTSIADARHQLEARIAQKARDEQLREQTARFNESLVALVRQAHEKLDEPAAMPQSYEQLGNGLDEPIEHAEQFVTENAAAVGEQAATLISSNIAEAKEVRGRLVQRWQHWLQFVRQRELGTAQLDKARVAIELAEQKACQSLPDAESDYENLMNELLDQIDHDHGGNAGSATHALLFLCPELQEAQSSLTSLNATIDQLQQLADKLDPLAMAYAEVRFLDVDFEQLEKHYGDVLGQMHNEIEHERALMAEIERTDRETDDLAAQLPSMDTNLKALQHVQQTTIPTLEAKIVMLEQQSQQQKPLRKYVLRSTADASPDGLAQRVEQSKTQAQEAAQQLVDRSVARIRTVLVQSPAASEQLPSDQRIDECAKELEEDIPLEHPLNNELRQQLEQLRGKVKRRDAIQSQIDERLTTIGKELEEFSDHKQQQQCAAEKVPREEQINELRKALERLENGIVPTLSSLQDEAVREGIPLQPTEEQQHQLVLANQIVQSLKTDLDKRVAENERASAVINEIRVLRSLVEGMVVEQTAEEASLQLNLESLGKVAAKSQEISSNSLHPEEQALMKESEEEANRKMERLNSLNTVLQQQIELLRAWARDKDSLELRTSSLIDDFKKVEEKRPQEGQVTAAAAEEELAKLDALKSGVGEARDEMMRMQCWLVQKLPKCGRAQIELQLQPVEDSLVQLNTDLSGTMQQLNKCVEFEHNLLEERTALLNALDHLNEQVQLARAIEDPHDQSSELDKLQNELEHIEQQMRNLENKSVDPTQTTSQIAHSVNITMTSIADARHQLEARIAQKARDEHLREQTARFNESLLSEGPSTQRQTTEEPQYDVDAAAEILSAIYAGREPREVIREHGLDKLELDLDDDYGDGETEVKRLKLVINHFHISRTKVVWKPSRAFNPRGHRRPSDINSSTSPIPEDPKHAEEQHSPQKAMAQRQHSRWRRVLRTALPLQAMLVLLLGAACLVPHCDDEYCCHLLNNFARSFDTQLDFINGPPPF
ncbi:[Pyruvate dehydrogenase [acetyl-transferring]]-phosphatase 1, mitochondrial, partial [Globodera pallida]